MKPRSTTSEKLIHLMRYVFDYTIIQELQQRWTTHGRGAARAHEAVSALTRIFLRHSTSALFALVAGLAMPPLRSGLSKVFALDASSIAIMASFLVVATGIPCPVIASIHPLLCSLTSFGPVWAPVSVLGGIIPIVWDEIQGRGLLSLALMTGLVFGFSARRMPASSLRGTIPSPFGLATSGMSTRMALSVTFLLASPKIMLLVVTWLIPLVEVPGHCDCALIGYFRCSTWC